MINRCTLLGRLAKDAELRTFDNGGVVCKLRLITSRKWRDSNGEWQEKPEGHNVAIYAETIARRLSERAKKGDVVYVEGPLETRSWGQGEQRRYATEIAVRPRIGGVRHLPASRAATQNGLAKEAVQTIDPESDPLDGDALDGFLTDDFGDLQGDAGFLDDPFDD